MTTIAYFLIDCPTDNSAIVLPSNEVTYDPNAVEKGSSVKFLYSGKQYDGDVVDFGDADDLERLKTRQKEMKKEKKQAVKRAASFRIEVERKRKAAKKGREFVSQYADSVHRKKPKGPDNGKPTNDEADTAIADGSSDSADDSEDDSEDSLSSDSEPDLVLTDKAKAELKTASTKARANDFKILKRSNENLRDRLEEIEKYGDEPKGNKQNEEKWVTKEGQKIAEANITNKENMKDVEMSEEESKPKKPEKNGSETEYVESFEEELAPKKPKTKSHKKKKTVRKPEDVKTCGEETDPKKTKTVESETEEVESSEEELAPFKPKKSHKKTKRLKESKGEDTMIGGVSKSKKLNDYPNKKKPMKGQTESDDPSDKETKPKKERKPNAKVYDGPMFLSSSTDDDVNSDEIPGVFISDEKLSKAKEKDCATELARTLFRGIFMADALLSCSLGGNAARGIGGGSDPRPSLDPTAVDAILKYVIKRQRSKAWKPATPLPVIKQSLRSMLAEMRSRANKKQAKIDT